MIESGHKRGTSLCEYSLEFYDGKFCFGHPCMWLYITNSVIDICEDWVPILYISDIFVPIFHMCEHLVPIFHTCEELVPILQICKNCVPILHICGELVATLHISENRVPILHIWEKNEPVLHRQDEYIHVPILHKLKYKHVKFEHIIEIYHTQISHFQKWHFRTDPTHGVKFAIYEICREFNTASFARESMIFKAGPFFYRKCLITRKNNNIESTELPDLVKKIRERSQAIEYESRIGSNKDKIKQKGSRSYEKYSRYYENLSRYNEKLSFSF